MKKIFTVFAVVSIFLFVAACGSSSKKNDEAEVNDGDNNEVTPDEDETAEEGCNFAEGLNEDFMVGDLERSFILRLPKDIGSDKKFPVIFLYHGYGDTANGIEPLLKPYINNETMPFILVVPESRGDKFGFDSMPPSGLEWDMMNLSDGNAEAEMFDAVLACIDKQWGVDEKHIHVTGFSAGAIAANSIALMRPEKVASILSYSGAYFSDPKSRDALGEFYGMKISDFFSWPDFAKEHNKYPQVFVFGDKEKDSWGVSGIFTIYFNQMARLGADYLTKAGHDALLCEHDQDHTVAGIMPEAMIKFFAAHPFGSEKSPYRENMPEEFKKCHFFTEADIPEEEEESDDSEVTDEEQNDDTVIEDSDDDKDETDDSDSQGNEENNDSEPEETTEED